MSEATPAEPVVEGAKPVDEPLGEGGIAALRTERARRAEAEATAAALAEKVKTFEDANKSATEKLQEQLNAAQKAAEAAQRDSERLAVIAEHQIPKDYQDLVQGSNADSLTAAAKKVQELLEKQAGDGVQRMVIPAEGGSPSLALNGDGIESALKRALGIA